MVSYFLFWNLCNCAVFCILKSICFLYYRSVIIATKKSAVLPSTVTGIPTNAVSVVSSVDSAQASDVGGESPGEFVTSDYNMNLNPILAKFRIVD